MNGIYSGTENLKQNLLLWKTLPPFFFCGNQDQSGNVIISESWQRDCVTMPRLAAGVLISLSPLYIKNLWKCSRTQTDTHIKFPHFYSSISASRTFLFPLDSHCEMTYGRSMLKCSVMTGPFFPAHMCLCVCVCDDGEFLLSRRDGVVWCEAVVVPRAGRLSGRV